MKEGLCFFLILAGLLPLHALAQYPSKKTPARFTITERKGCAPLSFQVNNPSCSGGTSCTARFNDGRPDIPFVDGDVITYPDPGNFTFRIIAEVDTNSDEIDIQVLPPDQPTFEVYSCETGGVQVVITDTSFPEYIIDFNDGPEEYVLAGPTPHNHVYPAPLPATMDIEVRGLHHDVPPPTVPTDNRANDNCPVSTLTATIYPNALNPAPIQELRVLDDGKTIELDIPTADPSVLYKLTKATNNTATGFTDFKNLYNVTTDAITTLEPDKDFYCFRLDTYNPCGGNVTTSNIICSINFDVTAENNQNTFTIESDPAGSPTYSVDRDGSAISPVSPDATVICNTAYTYQTTANYPDGTRSVSMHKTATAFSTDIPPSIENISSIAGESSVNLEWQVPSGQAATIFIISEVREGKNHQLQTSLVPTLTDNSYQYPTEYQVIYDNTCGVRSKPGTIFSRPMQLTGTLLNDNTIILNWSQHQGWKNSVDHYEIYANGQLFTSVAATEFNLEIPDDLINQIYTFTVIAVADPLAIPSIPYSQSNEVTIIKKPTISYPTAFTPNHDNTNDNFKVFSLYTERYEFRIFNRWGEMMFSTEDLNTEGWDGTFRGNPMPEGTYVFTVKIVDSLGRTFDRSGTVVLLKKAKP